MSPNETFNLDGVTATLDEISVDQKHMPLNVIFLQFILILFLSLVVLCVSFDSENSTNEVLGQFVSWRQIYLRARVFSQLISEVFFGDIIHRQSRSDDSTLSEMAVLHKLLASSPSSFPKV